MTACFAETAFAQFTITLQPNTLPAATNGTPYSQTVTAVGGNAPYTFSLLSGSLPAGLSLAANGDITGTPTVSGSPTFQIQADDVDGNSGFRTYSLSVGTPGSLGINPGSLPNGSQGVPYNQALTGTGGTGPYTFSLGGGSLPTGMSISSAGVISGTPTVPGPFNFTVDVRDSQGNTGSAPYTINIGTNSLTVSPPTLPNGTQGTPYSHTVTASGGTGPYTFSIAAGALPNGLSLAGNGDITGTPTVPGPFSFTVRAIDSVGNTGAQAYSVNIGGNILTVTPPALPNGTRGTPYNQALGASGGTGPYSFAVTAGALPAGLSMNPAGVISGTPSANGVFGFTVQATDTLFNTGSQAYSVTIGSAPLTLGPPSLPAGTVGTPYSQNVTANGGTAPYTYAVVTGALPPGLALNGGTGAITGTPTTNGAYSFTVQATDGAAAIAAQPYTVNIGGNILTVSPASLPNGTQGAAYNQTVTASGGTGPYTFSLSAGALPAGLSLNSGTGAITGTLTGSGASAFTVQAQDSVGNTGSRAYNVNVGTSSLTINPASLPAAVTGRPYSQTVTATGGSAPYTFVIVSGALPAGLTLNAATGVISGTPSGLGAASFTVQATDANANIGSRAYTITNRPDPALDPEVQGLVASQVATTQRFASAQIDNVTHHLDGLHNRFQPCSFNFGIAPPIDQARQPYSTPYAPYGYPQQPYGNPPYGAPPSGRNPPGATSCAADWASSLAFWTAGSFQFGSVGASGLTNGNHFNTGGVTGGVDFRATDDLIAGIALGYGGDRSDIGQNGTRSTATSVSGTLYASLRLFDPLFLDAAVGYGSLNFDNRRFVTGEGTFASGSRTGSYWFGALSASLELGFDRFKFAPYVKTDFMSATLGKYAEVGSTAQLLTYNEMKTNAVSGAVGLRGSIDIPVSYGTLTPTARLEYRRTSQGDYSQIMYYSDLGPSVSSAFGQLAAARSMTTAAFGYRVLTPGGLSVELEYGISSGTGSFKSQTIRGALRMPF